MSGVMTVRWVYSRSKAKRRACEMGSEGFMERAAGGSRSSTVAWRLLVLENWMKGMGMYLLLGICLRIWRA